MPADPMLLRMDTQQSFRGSVKANELRSVDENESAANGGEHSGADYRGRASFSAANWGSLFRRLLGPKDPSAVTRDFQTKSTFNTDTQVAAIEAIMIVLSYLQLDFSARSPRWRENRMCAEIPACDTFLDEGSFLLPDCIRLVILAFALIRGWIRVRFLYHRRHLHSLSGRFLSGKMIYVQEALMTLILPYPGLEKMLPRHYTTSLVLLSIAVSVRFICWRHLLYFPYPIRRKEKVANFSDGMQFSYRAFVMRKVFEDSPFTKIATITTFLVINTTFLLSVLDSINATCEWVPYTVETTTTSSLAPSSSASPIFRMACTSMHIWDVFWLVIATCSMMGVSHQTPRYRTGQLVLVVVACAFRVLLALLVAVFSKKLRYSTMESRVNAFLIRMKLHNKKDLSAVMAVQASFRFNKSYQESLKWHQQDNSQIYYRPLSARLPNEVKKKLYISKFQANMKDIIKFNTDGDPLNAFSRHIEVITTALGVTLVEVVQLKRIYYRRTKVLEARRKLLVSNGMRMSQLTRAMTARSKSDTSSSVLQQAIIGRPLSGSNSCDTLAKEGDCVTPCVAELGTTQAPHIAPKLCDHQAGNGARESGDNKGHLVVQKASALPTSGSTDSSDTPEWGRSMLLQCEVLLAQLQRLEVDIRQFPDVDRRSTVPLPPLGLQQEPH